MPQKGKVKSSTRCSVNRGRVNAKSNDLRASPSSTSKFSRTQSRKSRSQFSTTTPDIIRTVGKSENSPSATIPKDAAVHFGNFYGLQGDGKNCKDRVNLLSSSESKLEARSGPKMEFTRQMVRNLERTVGTEEYTRQVSALFDETLEPPNFKLNPPPTENSIPDGRYNPSGYPLWYKEPYKTTLSVEDSEGIFEESDEEELPLKNTTDIFGEESQEEKNQSTVTDDEDED